MNLLFFFVSAMIITVLIYCGIHYLPGERGQMIASIPVIKQEGGTWHGINFTYYGFVIASATLLSLLHALILLKAAAVPLAGVLMVIILLVSICVPAASIIARLVEKKRYTFTIGGAFFSGLIALPACVLLVNTVLHSLNRPSLNPGAVLAAISIAYIMGEGLGRLGCISFGCCYGKPLKSCTARTRRAFDQLAVVFHGDTKKAVYEGALAGEKLIPVQAMTCILYTATALIAAQFFLDGRFTTAFLLSLYVSQLWRAYSETLRADFRGFSRITVYQKMSFFALPYGTVLIVLLNIHPQGAPPSILSGISVMADPLPMICLQAIWLLLFIRFGRSRVTTSSVRFEVVDEHI